MMDYASHALLTRRRLLSAGGAAFATAATLQAESARSSIVDVGNIRVGHFTDSRRPTGCTVVIFDPAAVAGVDVRGSAPGTRETDLLNPLNSVQEVNAILLSGGSAFGLDAATGVMRYLEEFKRGVHVGPAIVPIVPAAILFDLGLGDPRIRPDAEAGYQACRNASNELLAEGCIGAGAGATVGKLFGMARAMKAGIGSSCLSAGDSGLRVGALIAVNAVGDVRRRDGRIIAGARAANNSEFIDTIGQILTGETIGAIGERPHVGGNSTIGIVATNARLTKTEATKVAQMAHDGLARTINPVHTGLDGDTLFAAATGTWRQRVDVSTVGAIAAEAVATAVERAVTTATSLLDFPAYRDLPWAHEK